MMKILWYPYELKEDGKSMHGLHEGNTNTREDHFLLPFIDQMVEG